MTSQSFQVSDIERPRDKELALAIERGKKSGRLLSLTDLYYESYYDSTSVDLYPETLLIISHCVHTSHGKSKAAGLLTAGIMQPCMPSSFGHYSFGLMVGFDSEGVAVFLRTRLSQVGRGLSN